MPSIYQLKPAFQNLLRPLVRRMVAAGVTANQVTVAAMLLSFATGTAVAMWPSNRWALLALPATLFLRMALNAVDGMIAREHDMKTHLGALLNELGDVVSDAALYLPLARVAGVDGWLVVLAVFAAMLTEMTGVAAVGIGATRRYDGPMGKSDRAFAFGALALLLGLGVAVGWWTNAVIGAVGGLSAVTVVVRARRALREVAG